MPGPVAPRLTGGTRHVSIPADRCWSVPLLAACVSFLFSVPSTNSGVFYVLFMDKFGLNREAASWPSTIVTVMTNLMGFVIGAAQERVSIYSIMLTGAALCPAATIASAFVPSFQWMMVTFGFVYGISQGILTVTTSVYVVSCFEKYRSAATGLIFLGLATSGIVGPFLLTALEEQCGIEGTFLVFGALTMNIIPLVLLLQRPSPTKWPLCNSWKRIPRNGEESTKAASKLTERAPVYGLKRVGKDQQLPGNKPTSSPYTITQSPTTSNDGSGHQQVAARSTQGHAQASNTEVEDKRPFGAFSQAARILRTPTFYALLVPFVAADLTTYLFASTIVDYAIDKELPMDAATMLVTCIGVGALFGPLTVPILSDKIPHGRCVVASASFVLAAVCVIVMPHLQVFAAIAAATMVTGVQLSYLGTIKPVLAADYLGVRSVPVSFGLVAVVSLPLTFCEPSIVGLFRDSGGSYDNLYRLCGGVDLIAALLLMLTACIEARGRKTTL